MEYSKEELDKIFNENKPTPKLMSMEFEKYGPKGLNLIRNLQSLIEIEEIGKNIEYKIIYGNDRSKEISTK